MASNDYYGTQPGAGPQAEPGGHNYAPPSAPQPGHSGQPYDASYSPSAQYSYAPPAGWSAPTQPLPAMPSSPAPQPDSGKKPGAKIAGLVVAVALLSAAAGGAAGAIAGNKKSVDKATNTTQIVQGNSSAPDWSVTAAHVTPSVVAITVESGQSQGAGSGVLWDAAGNIVTNHHVVAAGTQGGKIQVSLGEQIFPATLVGTDPSTDLAVIKIKEIKDLKPITIAKQVPKVGQPVMAVGNPLGLSGTVTTGIVSALNRPVVTQQQSQDMLDRSETTVFTNAIQTSAPINPGNSGGALVNANGELIGINSSIATLAKAQGESGSIGIGFAIPAAQAKYVAEQLIKNGKVDHAWLGISSQTAAVDLGGSAVLGAKVMDVVAGSPAEQAGLRAGDIVTNYQGNPVSSSDSLVGMIRASQVGQKIKIKILRDGQTKEIEITLQAKR